MRTAPEIGSELDRVARELHRAAGGLSAPALVSAGIPQGLAGPICRADRGEQSLLAAADVVWRPPGGPTLLGFGRAAMVKGPAGSGPDEAISRARRLLSGWREETVDGSARPRLFLGSRFAQGGPVRDDRWAPFGGWRLTVPTFLFAMEGATVSGSATAMIEPGMSLDEIRGGLAAAMEPLSRPSWSPPERAAPPPIAEDEWAGMVAAALAEIASGRYRKVVLARSKTRRRESPIDSGRVLAWLAERHGRCFVFKFTAGSAAFVGASPELLCRVERGRFETASLAGSRPRGQSPGEDERLGADLLQDRKELAEHEFVTASINASLAPVTAELSIPGSPRILRLPNIQHLHTPITGTLAPGRDALDVMARLHPTPAVGGTPADAALDAIQRLERLDRGWYAGPVGWVAPGGDGEFAVALRSALICGDEATLYAGAGIVERSEPAREWDETELKLRPLTDALDG